MSLIVDRCRYRDGMHATVTRNIGLWWKHPVYSCVGPSSRLMSSHPCLPSTQLQLQSLAHLHVLEGEKAILFPAGSVRCLSRNALVMNAPGQEKAMQLINLCEVTSQIYCISQTARFTGCHIIMKGEPLKKIEMPHSGMSIPIYES